MKNKMVKKMTAAALTAVLAAGSLSAATVMAETNEGGTILWLSNLNAGPAYESISAYGADIAKQYGYDFQIVYGDMFNDPDANLSAVKNAMTNDVVAIVSSMDGGIKNICDEYPELYVCGFNTSMDAVYAEDGVAADLKENDHFLGSFTDGHADGVLTGEQYFNAVVEKGYTKVATMTFPGFAYPNLPIADARFRELAEEYNQTAETPIEVVGEAKVLEFAPLDESWFMEDGNSELDAIVAFCAGTSFVYPTMKTAIADGVCAENTKILTSGFDTEESIVADMGGDGVIQYISFSPSENIAWALTLIDKALKGEMYEDFTAERIDSLEYVMDSKEDIDNIMAKSLVGTADIQYAQITMDDLNACTTYEELKALFMSEQLSADALADR